MRINGFSSISTAGQMVAMTTVAAAAIVSTIATVLAFSGYLPWPEIGLTYGGEPVAWSGMALQLGVTLLLVMLALSLPSAARVLRLEHTHRRFQINMDDITRAYRAAHMADRAETFTMRREFDAVRERYRFLKEQPGLGEIDAELLTIAAQMSEQTSELAAVYSEEKVARAKESLKQRGKDAEDLQNRIQSAHASVREIRRMMEDVDVEESTVAAQIARLRDEVAEFDGVRSGAIPGKGRVAHLKPV